jgi:starch synthase (maltosyl-transferring)
MRAHPDRRDATVWDRPLLVTVDRERGAFSSWYELFPRSTGAAGKHGTFADAAKKMLPYVAEMGFDIVYLPPIHPIGRAHRKGPDNSLQASPNDPGSPWAIGAVEGGHKAVHPELGTIEDFRQFIRAARDLGLEVAMDIAFQASPDHPYLREHPEWFLHRADGSIQHAENPPKRYEDIVPFAFTGPGWESLWLELESVFLHWIEVGVRVFRVDNPHTKPVPFWQWCIGRIKDRHPDVIFLAEAFTRPKMMSMLAKVGFTQSYTYFTWRNTKAELTEYARALSTTELKEYFRPNFWPNTPDILPEHLRYGGRGAFAARAVLAATLSPCWGIYGPPFELLEHVGREGVEEYAQNEKYQLRQWDLGRADSLRPLIRRLNAIRRENRALQRLDGTTFHETDNEFIFCYSRSPIGQGPDGADGALLVVVNLDPYNTQNGWVRLDLKALGMTDDASFQVHDLLGDARHVWRGSRGFVSLDPRVMPAHVFAIRRHVRTEHSFEYYL